MRASKYKDLQAKMPAERQARNKLAAERMLHDLPLEELRAARELTQQELAGLLGVNQAAVSKLERRADMYVSTLARFVEAMGGKLEIRVVFPEGSVRISQFGDAPTTAA
jgi:DNA-binding XRE family transcriptional regulator